MKARTGNSVHLLKRRHLARIQHALARKKGLAWSVNNQNATLKGSVGYRAPEQIPIK